ncbi:hypothetical protein BGZ73_008630 [Actinomortierella ambigua]|nr:hypothetical protein BGZ73_008630 [Actinomortierella ambigua]
MDWQSRNIERQCYQQTMAGRFPRLIETGAALDLRQPLAIVMCSYPWSNRMSMTKRLAHGGLLEGGISFAEAINVLKAAWAMYRTGHLTFGASHSPAGASLWDVIRALRDQAALIPAVDIKYSDDNPFSADIVLVLQSNGIELRFEPVSQRLKLIIVDDFSRLRLTYQGGEVSSTKALPTFILVYKRFGPTYLDHPLEFPDGTTPVASHMYIFHGPDWNTASPPPLATVARSIQETGSPNPALSRAHEGRGELERVIAKIHYGVALHFAVAPGHQQKVPILLHISTPQDLLADIGPPANIYYKEEDKMKIHSETSKESSQQGSNEDDGILGSMDDVGFDRSGSTQTGPMPNDYFYNYFHLGIDVLFDGSSHVCKKIILHSNIPGHFDFQSYKRCPFVIHIPSGEPLTPSSGIGADLPPVPPSPSPRTDIMLHPPHQGSKAKSKKKGHNLDASSPGSETFLGTSADSASGSLVPSDMSAAEDAASFVGQESGHHHHLTPSPSQQHSVIRETVMSAVIPEKGITPDMKISMIMTLLEPTSFASGGDASEQQHQQQQPGSSSGVANKPSVILNRGSITQNPFGPTMLNGCDGAVFESMKNGQVATVILY